MRRALIIVNPVAGHQHPRGVADHAAGILRDDGWTARVAETAAAGHATELAREHGKGAGLVVVVGGDGTLRETVVGLRDTASTAPLGFVPMGNANVVARELGIPRAPREAVEVLRHGKALSIDVGRVGEEIFLAMVGVGYDGWTTAGVGRMRATRLGGFVYRHGGSSLIYLLAGLPALLRLWPGRVRLRVDGAVLPRRFPSVLVCNTETYALGWAMTPGARIDDGRLDFQANRRSAPWFVLWSLAAGVARRPAPPLIAEYGRGTEVCVEADAPFRWQMDGDPMPPARRLEIGVLPAYTRILVPADGA